MAVNAQRLVDEGYRYLKIKVHGRVKEDVERVSAVRQQVGPEIHLTVDANQSYDPKSAIQAIRRMEEFGIDLVEQPVPIDDFKGLELVTHSVDTIIEADESARSLKDVMTLASGRMVDAISIKIPKLGGLRRARTVADICSTAEVKFRVGAAMGRAYWRQRAFISRQQLRAYGMPVSWLNLMSCWKIPSKVGS